MVGRKGKPQASSERSKRKDKNWAMRAHNANETTSEASRLVSENLLDINDIGWLLFL